MRRSSAGRARRCPTRSRRRSAGVRGLWLSSRFRSPLGFRSPRPARESRAVNDERNDVYWCLDAAHFTHFVACGQRREKLRALETFSRPHMQRNKHRVYTVDRINRCLFLCVYGIRCLFLCIYAVYTKKQTPYLYGRPYKYSVCFFAYTVC